MEQKADKKVYPDSVPVGSATVTRVGQIPEEEEEQASIPVAMRVPVLQPWPFAAVVMVLSFAYMVYIWLGRYGPLPSFVVAFTCFIMSWVLLGVLGTRASWRLYVDQWENKPKDQWVAKPKDQ